MSNNPWDVAPTPAAGDSSENLIFCSIGRALTRWEEFETNLSSIFSTCVNDRPGMDSLPSQRAYGAVLTFRGRADMLKAAFEAYLNVAARTPRRSEIVPCDELRNSFKKLINSSVLYAARRNEIAHGQVRKWTNHMNDDFGFALFPSPYSSNKHTLVTPGEAGYMRYYPWPDYIYTSVEINRYADRFIELADEANLLFRLLLETRYVGYI